ncbi:hypothetical protein KCU77_g8102, partial [Aureobasidium melanogenum]
MSSASSFGPLVKFVWGNRKTGEQDIMSSIIEANKSSSLVVFGDVGTIAGHLLAHDDVMPYNSKRCIANELVEEYITEG